MLGEVNEDGLPRVGWYHVFVIVPLMVCFASLTYYLVEKTTRWFLLRKISAANSKSY